MPVDFKTTRFRYSNCNFIVQRNYALVNWNRKKIFHMLDNIYMLNSTNRLVFVKALSKKANRSIFGRRTKNKREISD